MRLPAAFYLLPSTALLLLLLRGPVLGQQSPESNQTTDIQKVPKAGKPAAKPKLSPAQEQGLRMLQAAQVEAASAKADMRALVLWQAAHAYRMIDPAKYSSTLEQAFRASLSIEKGEADCEYPEETCEVKTWLQVHILRDMCSKTQCQKVRELLPSAEPSVRAAISRELISHYINMKDVGSAHELLNQFADSDDYPYESATELMLALPQEERLAIFWQAMHNYEQHSEKSASFDDVATMIFRFWREFPAPVVTEAIDKILKRAKDGDEAQQKSHVNLDTKKGSVQFSSQYQFRLFQLMPVLEEVDKSHAEALLRENTEVQSALKQYPEGLQSLDPVNYRDTPPRKGETHGFMSMGTSSANDPNQAENDAKQKLQAQIQRQINVVNDEVATNPKQALSDAMNLPISGAFGPDDCPRARGLINVARRSAKSDPDVTKAALDQLRKLMDSLSLWTQAEDLSSLPDLYLRMGDEENARKMLDALTAIANKLYSRDINSDDPNQAFKAFWPSTNLWRSCVRSANKLSPSPAEQIVGDIPDPEIKTFVRLVLAISLLDSEPPLFSNIGLFNKGRHVVEMP